MTTGTAVLSDDWEKIIDLATGCRVKVNEGRSLIEFPIPKIRGDCDENKSSNNHNVDSKDKSLRRRWKAISSAIWNGGLRSFDLENESSSNSDKSNRSISDNTRVCVFNYKVPCTYDGLNPEPKALIQNAIRKDFATTLSATNKSESSIQSHETTTVGLMTAASMLSLRTATRSAGGIVVDAIVTAGLSNSRAAGAPADFFGILPPGVAKQQDEKRPPPGTINTVVVINGCSLTQSAMIEAYAIAVEAKCGACSDYSVACAKNAQKLAQGTGTDCAVLLCPSLPPNESETIQVEYVGKHCLLAELIGQAVREATGQAILSNIDHAHNNSMLRYYFWRLYKTIQAIFVGARPCVPPRPMDPVPRAPLSVVALGWTLVFACYCLGAFEILSRSATVLLAAAAWDRCLPEPPLSVHPVVLAGSFISGATKQWFPQSVFDLNRPLLGFVAGLSFMITTLLLFGGGSHVFVSMLQWIEEVSISLLTKTSKSSSHALFYVVMQEVVVLVCWMLEVLLFKTTFSLQLLCTIALQMANFLERSQLSEARAQLAWLCSRDPTHLNSEELAGGTLESLSENLSDGTVAPWFWYILFGPVGALSYRVANTLDSRIGYRGGRYEWFGKASARFDDLINLVPARLTAVLLCLASYGVQGCSPSGGLRAARMDRRQCSSPNAGWPMGAMAGILGVRLEKRGEYCLGKSIPGAMGPRPGDIRKGHKVAQLAGGVALLAAVCVCNQNDWFFRKHEL